MKAYLALAITTLLALPGCSYITSQELTNTAIGETFARIQIYMHANGEIPKNLSLLPEREGYINRTRDAWNRDLIYSISEDGILTLASLGEDGIIGGHGDDEDISRTHRTTFLDGSSNIMDDNWIAISGVSSNKTANKTDHVR